MRRVNILNLKKLFFIIICNSISFALLAQQSAKIHIIRPFQNAGALIKSSIYINGQEIIKLQTSSMVTVNFSEFGEKSITVGFWYNQKTLEKTKKTIVIKPGDEFFFIMNLNKSKKNLLNQTSKTDAQKVIENIASVNRLNLHFSESDSITTSFFVQKNLTEENSNSQQAQNQEKKDSLLLKETQTPPLITLTTTTASQLQPSDIDTNIPLSSMRNENKYALIIGNENYQSDKGINSEANVDYAINDAKSFLLYAESTLGIPKKNIQFLIDAKAIETHNAIKKIMLLMKATNGESEFLIYYAGHGIPDEKTGESYILPVDVQ